MRPFVHAALFASSVLRAQDVFSSMIQPVLEKDCAGCHGKGQTLSKLDLRTRETMIAGGARGPAVIPGNSAQSLLMKMISAGNPVQMPPGGPEQKLAPQAIEAFARWIDSGAPWSSAPPAAAGWGTYKDEDLWAFRPLRGARPGWTIDGFIDAKLKEESVAPAPPADRRTLIRRATIDLTGLPPTAADVDAFVQDQSPDAWRRLIDRLLESPGYGERWARHWLDVVRYGDTNGYSNDFERPNAWRYRDYVIRAFQSDKPYDRFVREQIAGDEVFPGDAEALIATGFLRAGPWEHTGMSVEAVTRQMFLDDVTHSAASTFLGLTLGCAKCHDHKFDPIPTRDYYRMQAAFATTEFARPKLPFLPYESKRDLVPGAERMKEIIRRTQAKLNHYDGISRRYVMKKHGVTRLEDLPKGALESAVRQKEGVGPAEFEELKLYQKHMQLYRESADRFEPKAFAVSSGPSDGATDGGPNLRYPKAAEYIAPATHVLVAGNVQSQGERVEPGVLSLVARYSGLSEPAFPAGVTGRRAALANWIADPMNPLTARVMVNRVWQYHFGRGIAADPSNFGKMGKKPSHPELLDALAARFIERGWSVKALHREIMLSRAYRRSGVQPADPDGRLLARYPARRAEAEVIRDSLLAVSGELSPEAGGPGVFPQINEDVARQPLHRMGSLSPAYRTSPEKRLRNRRTIYTFQQRSLVDPMVEVFNGPNLDLSCERRDASTVPTQAFTLFNGRFVHDMALAFAARVDREVKGPARTRIESLFRDAYGRNPGAAESRMALAHFERMLAYHRAAPPPPPDVPRPVVHTITSELTGESHEFTQAEEAGPFEPNLHPSQVTPAVRALADVALVIFNSNEFI
jgi:hypothetical protein